MKYTDDLMRHIEDNYDHIHFLDFDDETQDEVLECWRDHDPQADGYINVSDSLTVERAHLTIQLWLTGTYENYLEESYTC